MLLGGFFRLLRWFSAASMTNPGESQKIKDEIVRMLGFDTELSERFRWKIGKVTGALASAQPPASRGICILYGNRYGHRCHLPAA